MSTPEKAKQRLGDIPSPLWEPQFRNPSGTFLESFAFSWGEVAGGAASEVARKYAQPVRPTSLPREFSYFVYIHIYNIFIYIYIYICEGGGEEQFLLGVMPIFTQTDGLKARSALVGLPRSFLTSGAVRTLFFLGGDLSVVSCALDFLGDSFGGACLS